MIASSILLLVVIAAPPPAAAGDAARGKAIYERYCISCHGSDGDGNGDAAAWFTPKPRDYRQGTFKWRSTVSGSLPLPSDLERTISNGVYGTHMPSWFAIGERSRRDVIAYLQRFSSRWKEEAPGATVPVPPDPRYSDASVARGKALYDKMQCAACHGPEGLGDGPSASDLKDDWGNAIRPYDLTRGHIKCGNTGTDIYRVFMTGLNGTPMPSFADALDSAQAWDLVHYIQSLSPNYPRVD